MFVAKSSDELWVGVKGQSNLVIAGSPRNAFRCSLRVVLRGYGTGWARASNGVPNPTKPRIPYRCFLGVRLRVLRFVVEREKAQTVS